MQVCIFDLSSEKHDKLCSITSIHHLNPLTCLEKVCGKATAGRAPALNCQLRQRKCNSSDFTLQFNQTHSSRGNSCSLDQKNRLTRIINILQAHIRPIETVMVPHEKHPERSELPRLQVFLRRGGGANCIYLC